MASGSISRVQEKPPALPVKQHRSHSSRGSSASDCVESVVFSPVGLQHQNYTYVDVFPEPTDCHAAQCPIHQRYDLSRHHMRFFSDGTPPPVPKKRLTRTLSLPGTKDVSPFSPLSPRAPLQMYPQHFDNPLYMLAPIRDTHVCEGEVHTVLRRYPAVPSLTFSQLSFDTPDEHLPYLFSDFDDLSATSQGILNCHLLFLRSMAQKVVARILLQGEAAGRDVRSYRPQEFFLCEGVEPQQVGDAVYYSLHSPRFPGRVLGLRLHTPSEACSTSTNTNFQHVNVQHIAAHFTPSCILKDSSSTTQTQDSAHVPKSDCTAAGTPCGGSDEYANYTQSSHVSTVQRLLDKGHSVSVERDLPQATLEDFVEDGGSLQRTDSLLYDKRVCFLLLQILMGAQHLYNNSTLVAELRPRGILLMWPCKDRGKTKKGENVTEENVSEMHRLKSETSNRQMWEEAEKMGRIQTLWKTLGSPRVVISCRSDHTEPQPNVSIKAQIGALIQYCLDPQEGQVSLSKSSYRRVLLSLASQLHRDSSSSGLQMADMVTVLQVHLWGPCWGPLFNPKGSVTPALHNWLMIKRALLVMKLAEKGLIQDQSVLDWEDCLCLQYLAFTDPEAVVNVTSQLQITE